jgi:hypothetical protein
MRRVPRIVRVVPHCTEGADMGGSDDAAAGSGARPAASDADGVRGSEDRVAHAERIKREALLELREARLELQAARSQIEALQQRLTLEPAPANDRPGSEQQESNAGALAESVADTTANAVAEGEPGPDVVWGRLQSYHHRLAAWSTALHALHADHKLEQQQLHEDREVLERRLRAHEGNRQSLQASLTSLSADRAEFESKRASWRAEVEAREREFQRRRDERAADRRDMGVVSRRLQQVESDLKDERLKGTRLQDEVIRLRAEGTATWRPAIAPSRAAAPAEQMRLLERQVRKWRSKAEHTEATLSIVEATLSWRVLLNIRSEDLLRDLMARHATTLAAEIGSSLVTCGTGPWDAKVLDSVARDVGFDLYFLDEAAHQMPVFLVGREGVDIDLLRTQLDLRYAAGEPFWLFSQELFVLSTLCGHDLLQGAEAPVVHLVPEFAEDHPVLREFLSGDEWRWPIWESADLGDEDQLFDIDAGNSPLSNYGYHVGVGAEPAAVRRQLLESFWAAPKLDPWFLEHHDAEYLRRWGSARSGRRLTRMVRHILWLHATQGQDTRKAKAAQDWKADLRWMKANLAPRLGSRWRWPNLLSAQS